MYKAIKQFTKLGYYFNVGIFISYPSIFLQPVN